jgi:hypothetical protein
MKDRCEIMVTFQSSARNGVMEKREPSVQQFEDAFKAFRAKYPDVHVFTTWNEPDNGADSGDGLDHPLPPETAAHYYLALRRNCRPSQGCFVSTPDLFSWYDANSFQMKCSSDPDKLCATGSYLDQLKYYLARDAKSYGLPANFRPEYIAMHPWSDSFNYTREHDHCNNLGTCVTKAADQNLGGSWGKSFFWMTEVGVHSSKGPDEQACGGAFLNRLFRNNPRVVRYYYYTYCHAFADGDVSAANAGPGNSCKAGTTPRPIMKILRDRTMSYSPNCK